MNLDQMFRYTSRDTLGSRFKFLNFCSAMQPQMTTFAMEVVVHDSGAAKLVATVRADFQSIATTILILMVQVRFQVYLHQP